MMSSSEDDGVAQSRGWHGRLPQPFPTRWVQYYLTKPASLGWLLIADGVAFLVGVNFYVHSEPSLQAVSALLYPLFGDSPTGLALASLSVATILPYVKRTQPQLLANMPSNHLVSILHTLAFVWLIKYGIWTGIALNLRPDLYIGFTPALLWEYWGILLTHAFFILQAMTIPYYGETSRTALFIALVLLLSNDVFDYGFGLYPPLRYEAGTILAMITLGLSVAVILLAADAFDSHSTSLSGD
ncbi:DUF1405 domain-containing protein [Haloquadratum walsbyi]|nr:DUF1405 domain-containing protein [Haloquadratum walsbyi]